MTNRRKSILMLFVLALLSLPIVLCATRLMHAQAQLERADGQLQVLLADVQEVIDLRSRQQLVNLAQRPTQDVIAQVNGVLVDVGIATNRLKSLTPESDGVIAGSAHSSSLAGVKRQSLRLTLEGLTVDELGAFLIQWRSSQRIWTPSRIELTHVRGNQRTSGSENRYDVTILISAIYIDTSANKPTTSMTSNSI